MAWYDGSMDKHIPLLRHRLFSPSTFRPEALMETVRMERRMESSQVIGAPIYNLGVLSYHDVLVPGR